MKRLTWQLTGLLLLSVALITGCGSSNSSSNSNSNNGGSDITDSLVAHYAMNGNANDSVKGYNGTAMSGATLTADHLGQANKAYSFDGTSNGYIDVAHKSFVTGNAISVGFWYKVPATSSHSSGYFIMGSQFGFANEGTSSVQFCMSVGTDGSTDNASGTVIADTWTYVVGTFDGSDIKIYINGELAGTKNWPGSIYNTDRDLTIGGWPDVFSYYLNCSIDDLRIYNKALSASEVSSLYQYLKNN